MSTEAGKSIRIINNKGNITMQFLPLRSMYATSQSIYRRLGVCVNVAMHILLFLPPMSLWMPMPVWVAVLAVSIKLIFPEISVTQKNLL